ncbi:DUF4198 domain-containing protein [Kiritimatiella glycovorans]|uniref:Nickel uptake substrate-specific transmembrane region n=1 Tax=Kiritimatiella glycovorans TaxID=1307763 RepID=A0A0G3EI61_9BACT|nr:DUF4198 domain-containing protein [Kiritimatiella glycovorans]AKJ65127.1 Nickel uptake substrate-specific transmembrane region [Kiritimatiella glycovorans]
MKYYIAESKIGRAISRARFLIALGIAAGAAANAGAHFQTLLPAPALVSEANEVRFDIRFTHPMEGGPVMDMKPPRLFGVLTPSGRRDLTEDLQAHELDGVTRYSARVPMREPGDHIFYLEPAPYWEPAEQKMIIHYTKVVVNAYGLEQGWNRTAGLPVEIRPLTRPYGIWAGNLFRGVVLHKGEPVPHAEIEVEYWNEDGTVKPPAAPYITQVIHADADGVFAYAMPRSGWWGFAALLDGEEPMLNPEGENVDVELGGLIWIYADDME